MKNTSWLFILYLSALLACNSDSNQLPAPSYKSGKSITKTARLLGNDVLEITFTRPLNILNKTTEITLKNVSGKDLGKIEVMIEICSNPAGFENCGRQFKIEKSDGLKTAASWIKTYEEDSFFDTDAIVNVYVLQIGATQFKAIDQTILSGNYSVNTVAFKNTSNTVIESGQARGYIQADGTASFYLKTIEIANGGTKYYLVAGSLDNNGAFAGRIESTTGTPLTSSPFKSNNITSQKNIILKLQNPFNNVTNVVITLN